MLFINKELTFIIKKAYTTLLKPEFAFTYDIKKPPIISFKTIKVLPIF